MYPFGYINPIMTMGLLNPTLMGDWNNNATSPAFMAGKNFGDGVQKGNWLGALQGITGLGMLFAGFSYQNSAYNSLINARSVLFQPLAFQPQTPIGAAGN